VGGKALCSTRTRTEFREKTLRRGERCRNSTSLLGGATVSYAVLVLVCCGASYLSFEAVFWASSVSAVSRRRRGKTCLDGAAEEGNGSP
jgi:hypothetical protein